MGLCTSKIKKKNRSAKELELDKTPDDLRIPIKITNNFPYCYFGVITLNEQGIGTGFIVGPRLVLTAGHNVNFSHQRYQKLPNIEPEKITFIPAYSAYDFECADEYPYGKCQVQDIYVPEEFISEFNEPKSSNDWALLILKENIGSKIFATVNKK